MVGIDMKHERSIFMPKMGESVMEATIIKWLKEEGDTVMEGESLVEVATDKVDSEIPSPYAGQLKKIFVKPGYIVSINDPIAIMEVEKDEETLAPTDLTWPASPNISLQPSVPTSPHPNKAVTDSAAWPLYDCKGRFYSPLVRHIATQSQLSPEEAANIPGTGQNNRLTKKDLLNYLHYKAFSKIPVSRDHTVRTDVPESYIRPGDEVISMNRRRKIIADRMVHAIQTIPHVTSFVEADVTNLVAWRERNKTSFKQQTGIGLTYMPIFIQVVAQALVRFPDINVSVIGTSIIRRKAINIGIAVALSDGNLIVPVIKGADQLDLGNLAIRFHDLVKRARHNLLLPDDITEGTYTLSNIGSFQNLMGTPIIIPPQVGILALGSIVKKPAVITMPTGDQIAVRRMMYLSHTYDHRVVDGALGGQFVKDVANRLERFDLT